MKDRVVVLLLLLAMLPVLRCSSEDIDRTGLVKVADGVYAFIAEGPTAAEGLGANSGFVVGRDAVMVIDTRYTPEMAAQLYDAIRTVTDLPVKYVVNTHYHPDHVWGNSAFKEMGAVIFSTPATKDAIEVYTPVYLAYYREQKPETFRMLSGVRAALPDSLVEDMIKVDLGGIEAELYNFGEGHTAGDMVVSVPKTRTVFCGGLVSNGYHSNMGDQGADFENWRAILQRMLTTGIDRVVPGQGKVGGPGLITAQIEYLDGVIDLGKNAIRAGKSLSETARSAVIPGTEGFQQENMVPFNIQAVFKRYTLEVVDPGFTLEIPDDFYVKEGGGTRKNGRILWTLQNENGYSEIEVVWQRTNRGEIILQDIHDRIARHLQANTQFEMDIKGSKKITVGGREVTAAFGRWGYNMDSQVMGTGIWTWTMLIEGELLYSIQLSTNASNDRDKETANMKLLEEIAGTFKPVQ